MVQERGGSLWSSRRLPFAPLSASLAPWNRVPLGCVAVLSVRRVLDLAYVADSQHERPSPRVAGEVAPSLVRRNTRQPRGGADERLDLGISAVSRHRDPAGSARGGRIGGSSRGDSRCSRAEIENRVDGVICFGGTPYVSLLGRDHRPLQDDERDPARSTRADSPFDRTLARRRIGICSARSGTRATYSLEILCTYSDLVTGPVAKKWEDIKCRMSWLGCPMSWPATRRSLVACRRSCPASPKVPPDQRHSAELRARAPTRARQRAMPRVLSPPESSAVEATVGAEIACVDAGPRVLTAPDVQEQMVERGVCRHPGERGDGEHDRVHDGRPWARRGRRPVSSVVSRRPIPRS